MVMLVVEFSHPIWSKKNEEDPQAPEDPEFEALRKQALAELQEMDIIFGIQPPKPQSASYYPSENVLKTVQLLAPGLLPMRVCTRCGGMRPELGPCDVCGSSEQNFSYIERKNLC